MAAILLLHVTAAHAANESRLRLNFNREWKFTLGDKSGAEAPAFDDTSWEPIGLPHSFSIPYFLSDRFYVGYGWYRKHFMVPAVWKGKRLCLDFDGAFQDAQVFINGKSVGRHLGGYTGFEMDITDAVVTGDNVVAVRVNNIWNPQQAPRGADHVFSGGIYRDVWLVVTNPLHVTWYGTFVTTPDVSAESSVVTIKCEIENQSIQPKDFLLQTNIVDPEGKVVASVSSRETLPAGTTITFRQTSPSIAHPKLWHPDHPVLYTAVTKIYEGTTPVDNFITPFGFRWMKWTADQGFFLNGEHYYFHGANVHQDHAGWGDAATDAGAARDVKLIQDAGFDFIRGSHYPHSPAFAEACDTHGILFWSELCNWDGMKATNGWFGRGPIDPQDFAGYAKSCKTTLCEMIRIHRNHPSIIIWSMSNEAFFTDKSLIPQMKELIKQLVALSHELDPTRVAAIGGCQRAGFDKLGDVAGYNGDGARIFINPGIPSVVSEYGSTISDRPGKYEPGYGDLAKQPEFAWRSGQCIWCGFDHGTWLGHFGAMGLIDYFRLPKRSWYWYRNEYKHIPPPQWPNPGSPARLALTADKTTIHGTDATDDVQLIVTVLDDAGNHISNSPPVTLTLESGPGEFPTGPSITFEANSDIAIRDGQAAIEFRSYNGGTSVIRASSPGLVDAALTITTQGTPVFVAGVTPAVRPRLYKRFTESVQHNMMLVAVNLAKDRPTCASSEATSHSARLANDGSDLTYWATVANDPHPWWQVDLESLATVGQTRITFQEAGSYRYKIEVSEDGKAWKLAANETRSGNNQKVQTDECVPGALGRFLRIVFADVPAGKTVALAEVEAFVASSKP